MRESLALADERAAAVWPAKGSIELAGRSAVIGRVRQLLQRAAPLDTGVLIVGEPGADVESVARELHGWRRSAEAPFVALACGSAQASAALDRALFGAAPARTPADLEWATPDSGIAAARGGTLFLRDAVDLPAALQARLARVVRDGEVRIDGEIRPTGFRLVASAPPSIDSDVRENRFRADLYRRAAASRIDLPPLRDRLEDVPALVERLLEDISPAGGGVPRRFTPATLALLAAVNWPGNLAELRAVVTRAVAEARDETIQIEHILPALQLDRATSSFVPSGSLRDARLRFERDYISAVLQHHGWRMAEAAQTLGIQRPNLYRKARQLGIPLTRANE
jgi:DNA-binding NtrC family response regulator